MFPAQIKYDVSEIKRQKKNIVTRFVTSIITRNLVHSFKNKTRNQTQLPTSRSDRIQFFKEINIMYNLRNMTRNLDDIIVCRDLEKGRCCPKFHEFNANKKVTSVYVKYSFVGVKLFCIKM